VNLAIEDTSDDFLSFWQGAEGKALNEQKRLWHERYESRHPEVFEIYYGLYGHPDLLAAALDRFPGTAPDISARVRRIKDSLVVTAPVCTELFEMREATISFVLLVGLFASDAWVAHLGDSMTCFVAVEHAIEPRLLGATMAHETAHSLHAQCVGLRRPVTELTVGEALLAEGLAVYTASVIASDATEAEYLQFSEGQLVECERRWPELRCALLRDLDRPAWVRPTPYFFAGGEGAAQDLPVRSGYFAGYRIVRFLARRYAVAEMARWPLERARSEVLGALDGMVEPGLVGR
jgi:hypothetical protein